MTIEVRRSTRRQSKLRLALNAPPGGGRTFTALKLAFGVLGIDVDSVDLGTVDRTAKARVLVADTRQGRVNVYADKFPPFDVVTLSTYAPERFVELIDYAEQHDYEVLIIDTLSHEWSGEGGVLDLVDRETFAQRGNKEAAWKKVSPIHESLFERIYASKIDVIACFRAKQQNVLDKGEDGKLMVKRFGVGAVAREGWESDFDVACDIQPDGPRLQVVKTYFPALNGLVVDRPGFEFAQKLLAAAEVHQHGEVSSDIVAIEMVPSAARADLANAPADELSKIGGVALAAA